MSIQASPHSQASPLLKGEGQSAAPFVHLAYLSINGPPHGAGTHNLNFINGISPLHQQQTSSTPATSFIS